MFAADDHLGASSPLAAVLPGFRVREGQLVLAEAVAHAFDGGGHLLAEAATGIGKSLAYLVPAAFAGRRVVISTATKSLQEQLRRVDLPLARRATDRPLVAAVVKGRGSYLCRAQVAVAQGRIELEDVGALARLTPWIERTRTGDRDELDHLPPPALWRELAVGSDRCRGRRCSFVDDCFAEAARSRAHAADVVLVNHALYMADLGLRAGSAGGASVLPDHDLVVFDEAHLLEDVAADWLGMRFSPAGLGRFARDAERAAAAAGIDPPEGDLRALTLHAERLFAALPAGARTRLREPQLRALPRDAADAMRAALEEVARVLRGAGEEADALARQADAQAFALEAVLEPDHDSTVVWSERDARGEVELRTAPVDVAPLLQELLFDRVDAAVLVSATLALGDGFGHLRRRLGVREARELVLPSPFDVGRKARLYVPRRASSRGADGAPPDAVAAELERLVRASRGRALLLFASYRQLHAVHAALAHRLPYPVLRQGDAPRDVLLDRFRSDVDSVLFATASFWQGVDVPGESLSLVVMDKLPFAPPDDPLVSARSERAERNGASGFETVQLPRAAMQLKQGFGRLLRQEDDRGVVALLDERILTRRYGARLLAALPDVPLVHGVEDVAAFLNRDAAEA